MFKTIGILILFTAILLFQLPKLKQNGEKKEIWTFSILLFISTTLCIAVALKVKVPNPFDLIIVIFKPLGEFITMALK